MEMFHREFKYNDELREEFRGYFRVLSGQGGLLRN